MQAEEKSQQSKAGSLGYRVLKKRTERVCNRHYISERTTMALFRYGCCFKADSPLYFLYAACLRLSLSLLVYIYVVARGRGDICRKGAVLVERKKERDYKAL